MMRYTLKSLLASCLLVLATAGSADDTDLFAGKPPPLSDDDLPNVLIILDNTANWNQPFTNELKALVDTVNGLPPNVDDPKIRFRVGLMLFTESGGANKGEDGGYIRSAVRKLDTDYKNRLMPLVSSLDKNADKSNGGKIGKTMADAYYYFAGQAPYTGNQKVKTDYTGNTSGTAEDRAIYELSGNALPSMNGSPYNSPVTDGSCANNFIIYISNGAAQDNTSDTVAATNELSDAAIAAGISDATDPILITPSGSQANVADEWARFMKNSPLAIKTYTIDIDKVLTGQGPGWTAILKSMASVGGGTYFDVDSQTDAGAEILKALETIFSEIQSVNSVFAAVSLPVSVNTQGTFLNQVFIGMFRPDKNMLPRWLGNLKQYKLGNLNGGLRLLDADGASAINTSTGFLAECARSFWTPTEVDDEWASRPTKNCLAEQGSDKSNFPDGNVVEKGGQAYMLRKSTARNVMTCNSASCTSLVDFTAGAVSAAALGAADDAERNRLVNWVRGLDTEDENINGKTTDEMRLSAHGDVVHSRPVAIKVGSDVAVFYGGNDGMLRAVNGNRSGSGFGVEAGAEIWSFIPPEFYPQVKRIHDNLTTISFPGNDATDPLPEPKPYAIDGPISAYQDDTGKAWLFATMRRGGNAIYAFDVSSPASPTLMWRKGTGSLPQIGQTWSSVRVFKTDGSDPMVIFGGGYDTCEDSDPNSCGTTMGNRVYVLDAASGTKLVEFETAGRSAVADVFVVSDHDTKNALYAYVADTGGNVYRISGAGPNEDFSSTDPSGWQMTRIASLGCSGVNDNCSGNRKFLNKPDLVIDEDGSYVILIGSGDREKPLNTYTGATSVQNYFFMLRDKPYDPEWFNEESDRCGSEIICMDSLYPIDDSSTPTKEQLAEFPRGWRLKLRSTEQVVTSALTIFGTVTFSTHMPKPTDSGPGVCVPNLGTATVYNIDYVNAESANGTDDRGQELPGGGLPPSPVGGLVILDGDDPENGTPFCIGCSPDSPLEGSPPPETVPVTRPKGQVYWKIEK